jgi:predicted transcriptional regulator
VDNQQAERWHKFSKAIGLAVKKLRHKQQGLTQAGLAYRSGVSQEYISAVESGEKGMNLSTLGRIARALDKQLSEVVRLAEEILNPEHKQ